VRKYADIYWGLRDDQVSQYSFQASKTSLNSASQKYSIRVLAEEIVGYNFNYIF